MIPAAAELAGLRLERRPRYLALAAAAAQRTLTYRGARMLQALTGLVLMAMQYLLWRSVYGATAAVGAYDWAEMRTYVVLVFTVNALLPVHHEMSLYTRIRDGAIAVELTRPVDFQWAQLAEASGAALVELVLRGSLSLLLGVLVVGALAPPSSAAAALFAVSLVLGFVARFLVMYFVALGCFWLLNVMGLQWTRAAITSILSGAVVPLTLLPEGLREVGLFSPFAGMTFVPISIYLGQLGGSDAVAAIAAQVAWVAVLWLAARRFWVFCQRRLVVQGG